MCILLFVTCFAIDAFYACVYVPVYGGDYVYYDSSHVLRINTFYYISSSLFSQSIECEVILFIVFFVRDILTVIIGLTVNMLSLRSMRTYFRNRNSRFRLYVLANTNHSNLILDQKLRKSESSEKRHSYMVLSFCLISIAPRLFSSLSDIYYLFTADGVANLIGTLCDLSLVWAQSISFFVFYSFNRGFRKELHRKLNKFRDCFERNCCIQT